MTSFHEVLFPLDIALKSAGGPAAHRCCDARLRRRGAQRTLGTFTPALRRGLRREDFRRIVAGCCVFRGAARAPLRVSLARPARPFLRRTGRISNADRSDCRSRRWRNGDVPARQDLWRALLTLPASYREAGAGKHSHCGRGNRSGRGDAIHHRRGDWRRDVSSGPYPPPGAAITAGFLFDVPVRFDTDYLEVDLSAFAAGAFRKSRWWRFRP